jgi:NNP family nitrate/nitrite transporter-like MFS transporter
MGGVSDYRHLLLFGFFIGIALASFSVGVGFVSGWYTPERQGFALGVYGAGNVGQSVAAFAAPFIAKAYGMKWGFWAFGIALSVWLVLFMAAAKNAPRRGPVKPLRDVFIPLKDSRSWLLSLYYFLTFGGFVAMAIYLPLFLSEIFGLSPQMAGIRTAGFVLLATFSRPLGGVLADKIGGKKILMFVFPFTAVMAIFLACPTMPIFTIGALGMAVAIGLGNGAVFKLVPEYFPTTVGSVTGVVGAAGGLGGFFPPLLLGAIKQQTGSFTLGFAALSVFCIGCLFVLLRAQRTRGFVSVPA